MIINGKRYDEIRDKKVSCLKCAFRIPSVMEHRSDGCAVNHPDRPRCTAEFREDGMDVVFAEVIG